MALSSAASRIRIVGLSRRGPYAALAARLATLVLLLAIIAVALTPLTAVSRVVPASASQSLFSAERAGRDLAIITTRPHPTGSPEAAAVRGYLMQEIRKLGLEPELQRTTVLSEFNGVTSIVGVENVVVRLPGIEPRNALLLDAHYDSAPTGNGAGDCGMCTVALLEALRVMRAGPQLRNDVIFLFSDGEEVGDTGALAFRKQHSAWRDVRTALVFEGLGGRGRPTLYVHTAQTGGLTQQAFASDAGLSGYAFMNDIMWNLEGGSGSDLDVLGDSNAPALGFINLSVLGAPGYHTAADNLANTDLGTLQTYGDQVVALVRNLADQPLDRASSQSDLVYFSLVPGLTVRYPANLAPILAGVVAVVFLTVVIVALMRRRLRLGGVFAGLGGALLSLVMSLLAVTGAWWLLRRYNLNLHALRVGGFDDMGLYLLAWAALTGAVYLAVHSFLRRRCDSLSLAAGGLTWWCVLGLLTATKMPGLSAVFVLPALAASLAVGVLAFRRTSALLTWTLASGVGLLLMPPLIYVLTVYAGRLEAMVGLPSAALPVLPLALLTGLLLPLVEALLAPLLAAKPACEDERSPRQHASPLLRGAAAAALICLVLIGAVWVRSAPSAARPTTNTVTYELDADSPQARWVTVNDSRMGRGTAGQLDAWTRRFIGERGEIITYNPWPSGWMAGGYPALAAPAPVVGTPRAAVQVLASEPEGMIHRMRLHVQIPPEAIEGQINLSATGALSDLRLNGQRVSANGVAANTKLINFYGRHDAGIVLEASAPATEPLTVAVQLHVMGLPSGPSLPTATRPATMMTAPFNNIADATLVRQVWTIN